MNDCLLRLPIDLCPFFSVTEKKSEGWFSQFFGKSEPKSQIHEQTNQQKDTRVIR